MAELEIPEIDLVIVDLYPFEQTVASGASHEDIIEKIDIGGISLIPRSCQELLRRSHRGFQGSVLHAPRFPLNSMAPPPHSEERTILAREAFAVSSGYDSAIFDYMASVVAQPAGALRLAVNGERSLRYGENPHQQAHFFGNFDAMFSQLHGKEISYNNLLDIDSAVNLIDEFGAEPTVAILKHNNACGLATRGTLSQAWADALAGDPVSAFGGIIITNVEVDAVAAAEINKIFF